MRIVGFQKLTLLDFPGYTACTLFTPGCNFRCPFCHNAPLLSKEQTVSEAIPEEDVFRFLEKRRGLLDGVVVTGGEPLLQKDLPQFLKNVKACGYQVKLDTNGAFPDRLSGVLADGLADYVAMDIKSGPARYKETAGTDAYTEQVLQSIRLLEESSIRHEFRTTAVHELHTPRDFEEIGGLIRGTSQYFIQCFRDSGNILKPGLTAPDREELDSFLQAVRPYVPAAKLRGV